MRISKEARTSLGAILDEQECKYLPKYLRTQKTSGARTRETEGGSTVDGWRPITEFSRVFFPAFPWSIASSSVKSRKILVAWVDEVPGPIWFASKVRLGTARQERSTEQRPRTREGWERGWERGQRWVEDGEKDPVLKNADEAKVKENRTRSKSQVSHRRLRPSNGFLRL